MKPKLVTTKSPDEQALDWLIECCERARNEGPFSIVVELTPALANVLISLNPDNRTVRPVLLQNLIADIKDGRFVLNGETIIVSVDGVMNDGQHRCMAVVEANQSIKTFIAFGVERDSRLTVDTGGVRTTGDFLSMKGVIDSNVAASVASLLHQWEENNKKIVGKGTSSRPTKAQTQAKFHHRRGEIEVALKDIGSNSNMSVFGSRSFAAFCLLVLRRVHKEKADEFMAAIRDGVNLAAGDPRLVARERLRFDKDHRLKSIPLRVELLFRAWNMWREGKVSVRSIPIIGNVPEPK